MKTSNKFPQLATLSATALIGLALGWWLHGFAGQKTGAPPAATSPLAQTSASLQPKIAPPPVPTSAVSSANPATIHEHVNTVTRRMSTTYSSDIVEIMEAIGSLTRLTDDEIKLAWNALSQQAPSMSFGNGLKALYLWARMQRIGENVTLPVGWGAENFGPAAALETARQDRTNLLARLKAGEILSDTERRVIFTAAMQEDPLKAIQLWCSTTKPQDYLLDARWMGDALTNPDTRAAIMAQVRAWQAGGDVGGVVNILAQNWISSDPAAVEQWLKQPEQADVKDALLNQIINARVMANPADVWGWSQSMPESQRLEALGMSATQLANRGPDGVETGIKLIAELQNPDERKEAIKGFANILAANDFDQWQKWRDTLSPAEQDVANQSAFSLWANKDVDQAVQWLNTRPAGETRDNLVATLVGYYAERNPQTAAQWISTIADPDRRRSAASAALSDVGPWDLERVRVILNAALN